VWVVIQELKKDSIVILTTHDMDEAVMLNQGKIRESGTVKTIKEKYQYIGQLKLVNPKSSTTPIDMDIVRAWVATIFGSTSVTSQTANSLTIQILLNDVDILNNGLKLIATENIFEWQFKTSTVEDIFLSLNDLSCCKLYVCGSFSLGDWE
jgi:ABC-type multidrug transport system ATPase subunit